MRTLAAVGLLVAASACAGHRGYPSRPAPESLPAGSPLRSRTLAEPDAWLRHRLMFAEHPEAIQALRPGSALAPRDRLLHALQEGMVLHQAGDHAGSNRVLEWAEGEADRRYTRSLRREVGALLVNDGVLAYTPSEAELAMIPYYRMLNHLALGDRDGALVEARKANALLARLRREPLERCHEDGLVQYLAGLVQREAGELNDALVSLRHAEAALAECDAGSREAARSVAADLYRAARAADMPALGDSVARRYGLAADSLRAGGQGELLLLVEHGFVAHRTGEALHIPIFPREVEGLRSDDSDGIDALAARVSRRLMSDRWERHRDRPRGDAAHAWAAAMDGAYVLRLAWPEHRVEAQRPLAVQVRVGEALLPATPVGDLTAVVVDEMEEERLAMLTRMVARGMVKYLVSREVERKAEKKGGDAAGFVLGRLANLAGNRLEQPDTRSWSLLPDRISMVRVRLPAGTHRVTLDVAAADGAAQARHDLGEVRVEPGRLVVLRSRVWGGDAGELPPLRARALPPEPADSVVTADATH